MTAPWKCPKCRRSFTRPNQRHRCGTGDRAAILAGRADWLLRTFDALESFLRTLGPVEVVTRERYALFRTRRIFADVVVMKDALRVAIHLPRRVDDPLFFRVVGDRGRFSHVAKLRDERTLAAIEPYLREAFESSTRDD